MPKVEKGQSAPLNYTRKANHRVIAGLGWDPNEKASLLEKARSIAGGKKSWHDLDLACFTYDKDLGLIERITADIEHACNESGTVYHSGDNVKGVGEGDDEQISVELKDLPPEIAHIVFIASIKSGHTFSEVKGPFIRLADGYSGHTFLKMPLDKKDGTDQSVFVFIHMYNDGGTWMYRNISEFVSWPEDKDRSNKIKDYIR